jgi:hypothetical protein
MLKRICGLIINFAIIAILGCGGGSNSSDNASVGRPTAVTFRLSVNTSSRHAPKLAVSHAIAEPDICNDYLIDTIDVQVYRTRDNTEVAATQEACAAHTLTISPVPAGEPLYVVCKGSISGAPVWQGRRDDVVAKVGQSTDIGVIQMQYTGTDSTAPEIASTFPPADAANVEVFAPVIVVFTEKLAPGTIPDQAIVVSNGEIPVPGEVSYDSGSQTIRFMPVSGFHTATTYTVMLQSRSDDTGPITDIDGHMFSGDIHWQFTTRGAEDNTPPQVIATSPLNHSVYITASQASITALFNEPMDPESFAGDALQITSHQGAVSGKTTYDALTRTLSFIPDSALEKGVSYTAVISAQARDLADNPLAEPYTWQFVAEGYIIETSVIPESGCGGTIHPANAIVLHGEDITVDIVVEPYHRLSGLVVDDGPVPPTTAYSFENVTENHTIQAIIKGNVKDIAGHSAYNADFYKEMYPIDINAQGHVVWTGENPRTDLDPEPDQDIYYFDGSKPINISEKKNPNSNDWGPQTNDRGNVVWMGKKWPTDSDQWPDIDIYYYDQDRSTVTNISETLNPDGDDLDPQINDQGHVVWRGQKEILEAGPMPDWDIYYYDGSKTTNISETLNPDGDDSDPQINDQGHVVWNGRKSPPGSDQLADNHIYYYDGSKTINIHETLNLDGNGWGPQINAQGNVVWIGREPTTNSDPSPDIDIYYCDHDKLTVTNISENLNPDGFDRDPQINGRGIVVWNGHKSPSGPDGLANSIIYYYDGSKTTNIHETLNLDDNDLDLKLNDQGIAVWIGPKPPTGSDPSPGNGIYYYDHDRSKVTLISETLNPDGYDWDLQINGQGHVVWMRQKPVTEMDIEPDKDIYYYNQNTSTVTNISEAENPVDDDLHPLISAQGHVVWFGHNKIFLSYP